MNNQMWYVLDPEDTKWGPFKDQHSAEEWASLIWPDGNYDVYKNSS